MSHRVLWLGTCFILGVGFSIVALCVGVKGWDYFALLVSFVLGVAIAATVGLPEPEKEE